MLFCVPVSSQAIPRLNLFNLHKPCFTYSSIILVISISPLSEGLTFFANFITLLSKKYNPVIAISDFGFFGFSSTSITLSPSSTATPKLVGLDT